MFCGGVYGLPLICLSSSISPSDTVGGKLHNHVQVFEGGSFTIALKPPFPTLPLPICSCCVFSLSMLTLEVMHRILVEDKRWISENRFLRSRLNYCMLLPGPEAQQLAAYIGWLLRKTRGGLVAGGSSFVLPGFISILALSIVYAEFRDYGLCRSIILRLKPAIMAVVIEAVIRIGKRAL